MTATTAFPAPHTPAPFLGAHGVRRRRLLLGAAVAACARPAWSAPAAEPLRIGINAGVSFAESEEQQRRRYAGLLDGLGRSIGQRLDFSAVYSDRVSRAVKAGGHDLLLVHTHAALRAGREAGWRVLAFSEDRRDNAAIFFVRPDDPRRELAQLAGLEIGAPGLQSWATATARAELRRAAPQRTARFRTTRMQDVVPYMVQLRTVDAGVCRDRAVVEEGVAAGRIRVVHRSAPQPLYALIAAPGLHGPLCDRLCQQSTALATPVFDGTPLRALQYSDAELARLQAYYADA